MPSAGADTDSCSSPDRGPGRVEEELESLALADEQDADCEEGGSECRSRTGTKARGRRRRSGRGGTRRWRRFRALAAAVTPGREGAPAAGVPRRRGWERSRWRRWIGYGIRWRCGSDPQAPWAPRKRDHDEDDASISWRKRKKHFFILSNSGKPIYSRYGDEHKLAGFSATLQAIISFVENGGDRVKLVRAGKHQVVFLVKGPIYLVCISCTEEPYESLRGQLELIYGQMIVILTKSVNRCFVKNPKFDMTPLLGGTDAVFSSLIHSFSWNPATFLHAYTCQPLAYATRQAAGAILQDVADSGVLFAILMCKHKVISLVGAQKASLHPDDMLLLSNFIMSSESFRTSESFSPICLPRYNPMAFLYAYVHYFDVDTYLILLTTSSDAFFHLKDCRIRIESVLVKSNVLSEVQRSLIDGGMHIEELPDDPLPRTGTTSPLLGPHKQPTDSPDRYRETFVGMGGPAGLWHFIYRSIFLDQYVSSEFSSPINTPQQQKRQHLYSLV
uniref:Vacuolar fusion protein MON1 homolog n=1 Tax=Hypericum perforatum TaxID=65561 RepID=A0A3S9Y298_HYPPE|nr:SAND Family Protein [Hypericum perforatum]